MKTSKLSILAIVLWCVALAGCQEETSLDAQTHPEEEPAFIAAKIAEEWAIINGEDKPLGQGRSYTTCRDKGYCNNCVFFAACRRGITFPLNLSTAEAKCQLINKSQPATGYIAVMDTQHPVNHVAYVFYVSPDKSWIMVSEGNYYANQCSTRRGTPAELGVIGYYNYGDAVGRRSCSSYGH